jgi:hypothetical protein
MPIETSGLQFLRTKRPPLRELRERDLLDQSLRVLDAPGVMHDSAVAEVNSVVSVAAAKDDQMRARGKLLGFVANRRPYSRRATDIHFSSNSSIRPATHCVSEHGHPSAPGARFLKPSAGNGGSGKETRLPELRVHFRNRDSGYNRKQFGATPLMNEIVRASSPASIEAALIGHSCDLSDLRPVTYLQSPLHEHGHDPKYPRHRR